MADIEFKQQGKAWRMGDVANRFGEWTELCEWALTQEGLSVSMAVQASGDHIVFQAEGVNVPTVRCLPNNHIVWNGSIFTVMTDDELAALT